MSTTGISLPRARTGQGGFTLIEVLLAMAITAFVAIVAYTGLSTAITAAEVNEDQATRLAEIQAAVTVLDRDIRHTTQRSIVDEYGTVRGAVLGSMFEQFPLELTRIGWDNPRNLRRAEIQRVRYYLEDNELWRQSWAVLDQVSDEDGEQSVMLLDEVEDFRVRFMNNRINGFAGTGTQTVSGEWVEEWNSGASGPLPQAMEFILEIESFGEVRRVIEVVSQ